MIPASELASLPPEAFLRLPTVLAYTGLKRSATYAMVKKGCFPPPERLTSHAVGWRVGAIREWLADPTGWAKQPKTS